MAEIASCRESPRDCNLNIALVVGPCPLAIRVSTFEWSNTCSLPTPPLRA